MRLAQKGKKMRIGQNGNLEKALFDWFERMQMKNLPIRGTILKEKAISYAQELQARTFNIEKE